MTQSGSSPRALSKPVTEGRKMPPVSHAICSIAIAALTFPAVSFGQQAAAGAAAGVPAVVVAEPGQAAGDAVKAALRAAAFARYPAAEAAVLLHRTTPAPGDQPGSPRIISGKILSTSINVATAPGLAPTTEVSFRAANGAAYVILTFRSAHGQQISNAYYAPYRLQKHGSWTFQDYQGAGPKLYAEAGNWTLTSAEIVDGKYQKTTYDARRAAKLFQPAFFTVINNGTPDFTPPTISAGAILTQHVNLNNADAAFKASMTGSDDVSGIAYPILVVRSVANPLYTATSRGDLPLPQLSGTFTASIPAFDFLGITGAWQIVGYGAADVAGNVFMDDKEADVRAVFGKTHFHVDQ